MSLKPTLAIFALALFLTGCNEESPQSSESSSTTAETVEEDRAETPEEDRTVTKSASLPDSSAKAVSDQVVSTDWSYKRICNRLRTDQARYRECLATPSIRKDMAESQASTVANMVAEMIESYGANILETNLNDEIEEEAKVRPIEQVPVDLAGVEIGVLPGLPDYFKVTGSIFGYRTEVGLSAVIAGRSSEVMVSLDLLDEKQREYLEMVCSPELNWQDSTCQGDIYIAVLEGTHFVELSLVGAKLVGMDREKLKEIELRKLW